MSERFILTQTSAASRGESYPCLNAKNHNGAGYMYVWLPGSL